MCPCFDAAWITPHDPLSYVYIYPSTHTDDLDKDGVHLLQQCIDIGERNRIKWLSLPDPLARYVSVEGDHHKDHKVLTSHHNGLSCKGRGWIRRYLECTHTCLVYALYLYGCMSIEKGYVHMNAYKMSTLTCVYAVISIHKTKWISGGWEQKSVRSSTIALL